jgi:hypothetical protein
MAQLPTGTATLLFTRRLDPAVLGWVLNVTRWM